MFRKVRKWVGIPFLIRSRAMARAFLRGTARADEYQEALLRALLSRHAGSDFGREHGLAGIQSPSDYRRRVPIRDYDGHEPYIARVRDGELGALFGPGTRVRMFAMTSGTTARPKTIPVTDEFLAGYRDGWRTWGIRAFDDHPETVRYGMRPLLQLASDWRESHTASGIPCGAITGLTAQMQHPLVRVNYCMPPMASRIKDIESKYYVALRLSSYRHVGAIIAANPSTLLGMARLGDREKETLIRDLRDGTLDPKWDVPGDVRHAIRFRIGRKRVPVSRRLDAVAERTGRLVPKDIWPDLQLLANWVGGTMGAYLRLYPEYFGDVPVRDPGLIASEGRMTIPFEDASPAGVLDYRRHFFEFIPEGQEDHDRPDAIGATELIEGRRYFILLTTASGLYRYDIRDLVECVGFEGRAPVLKFLNKGSHISSLTGEKLTEHQVVAAVDAVQGALAIRLRSFLVAPSWGDPPHYTLLIEADDLPPNGAADRLDEALDRALRRQNPEYENKRSTRRLGPIRHRTVARGSWDDFRRRRLAGTGGTVEQYKQPCLLPDPEAIRGFRFADGPPSRPEGDAIAGPRSAPAG